jgi:hypothetical protein
VTSTCDPRHVGRNGGSAVPRIVTLTGLAMWHETPAQNVRKGQRYDYLVSTNAGFRTYRMRKGMRADYRSRSACQLHRLFSKILAGIG